MKLVSLFTTSGLALALVACGAYALSSAERDTTELGALKYATASGGSFVSCSGQDSDGDSYVTCTIKDNAGVISSVLCSYQSPGCKPKG